MPEYFKHYSKTDGLLLRNQEFEGEPGSHNGASQRCMVLPLGPSAFHTLTPSFLQSLKVFPIMVQYSGVGYSMNLQGRSLFTVVPL